MPHIALVTGGAMWGIATFLVVVLVGYLAHLRVETRRAAALARRRRASARRTTVPADARSGWASVDAATVATVAPQARPDGSWDPVDVPLPTYVTKPVAPQRPATPAPVGIWVDGLLDDAAADEPALGDDLDAILDRRAVGN